MYRGRSFRLGSRFFGAYIMEWSPDQEKALSAVAEWYRNGSEQEFRLFGYAGTGKTTLARHLAENTGGRVAFAAYTGKAASVLVSKGCPATTIHSLIYIPYSKSKNRLRNLEIELEDLEKAEAPSERDARRMKALKAQIREEKDDVNKPGFVLNMDSEVRELDLLIIDECSMVGDDMAQDLLSFGTKILVLGDPAQLPPVASAGYFTNKDPDYMLTSIHRQAENDPIIHLATMVREGKKLHLGEYGISQVVKGGTLDPEFVMAQDQLICGRNATRHNINRRCRELLGYDPTYTVVEGEKVVCLRNNRDLGILNGTLWLVDWVECTPDEPLIDMLIQEHGVENGYELGVSAWAEIFGKNPKDADIDWWTKKDHQEFDYGYALTCHKAQGSQWDRVMVFDESDAFRDQSQQWLYTAITRAAKSVTIVV